MMAYADRTRLDGSRSRVLLSDLLRISGFDIKIVLR